MYLSSRLARRPVASPSDTDTQNLLQKGAGLESFDSHMTGGGRQQYLDEVQRAYDEMANLAAELRESLIGLSAQADDVAQNMDAASSVEWAGRVDELQRQADELAAEIDEVTRDIAALEAEQDRLAGILGEQVE